MRTLHLKLTAALAGLILFVSVVSGVLIEQGVRERETAHLEESLAGRLEKADQLVELQDFSAASPRAVDEAAHRAAEITAASVTLIDPSGKVVGDSEVPFDRLDARITCAHISL